MRLIVKIGSTLITNHGEGVDHALIAEWVTQIASLHRAGHQVILVSSGAIAEGMKRLGWKARPQEVNQLQAAAAVGQMGLVQVYESAFRAHRLGTAQVLLTHDDLADRTRYLNARSTLTTLLSHGIVPVINENDTVITDEIKFGDNDTLAALVANLVEADLLVILTDQQGLYSADPRQSPGATLISTAIAGEAALERMAGGAGSALGRGGMLTKVLAAKRAAMSGASTVIAFGRVENVLLKITAGESVGTRLAAQNTALQARKMWLAGHLITAGKLVIDAGAAKALQADGKSLLPIGVADVEGDFARGDVVSVVAAAEVVSAVGASNATTNAQVEIARGLVNYSAAEARKICRQPTKNIEAKLGYVAEAEIIHRDNMVLVQQA
jgi:glutamate 5-kinase